MERASQVQCAQCGRLFIPRFRFQTDPKNPTVFYCSQVCREPALAGQSVTCSVCGKSFVPTLATQLREDAGTRRFYCSVHCLRPEHEAAAHALPSTSAQKVLRSFAVLNQKGGTGKTTTALNVAAGLATLGHKTLLIDFDPQGNIGASLGITSPRTSYHLLMQHVAPSICVMNARECLDIITSDQGLAAAEVELIRSSEEIRMHRLRHVLEGLVGYEYVVLDCAPSLSILNHNALSYAGEVLIPVSCDYLSLVGVKQVLNTLRRVSEQTGRDVRIAGVLPTFYDARNRICGEAVNYLRKTFGPKTLPPIRTNTKLAEAPSQNKTIFEYAPDSNGARDYVRVVEWLTTHRQDNVAVRAS